MRPLFAILPFLMNVATETGGGGGGSGGETPVDPAAALKQVEDGTLPMGQRLTVAAAALRGIDPTNQLAAVQQKLKDSEALVKTRDGEVNTAKGDLTTAQNRIKALEADVKSLDEAKAKLEQRNKDLEAKEQDFQKRAKNLTKEELASLGFPSEKLPAATEKSTGDIPANREQLEEAMGKLKTLQERQNLLAKYNASKN